MSSLTVVNKQGKKAGSIDIPAKTFDAPVNTDVLHQAVLKYTASRRQGTASTKDRSDVSGGGTKPYRQKGTGRARVGSIRSPLFVHGGVVFGPHPRDFGYSIPRKIKRLALKESLNAKLQAKTLIGVEEFKDGFSKTKEFAAFLSHLKLKGKILALLDGCHESVLRVSRNIPFVEIMTAEDVNAYDILRARNVLITKTAFEKLLKRIGKS